ncbi:cadherin domain-containing protein [Nostoc sp. XA010]|uniref:beta strand repeat-containing protein n=1 Tax=Nostoc sp. XA010 TaxID=2780407 RepID=UPI001E29B21B|nr:cadherin domain-containing protein [Nostoc sp. XA010]MCC5658162.1 cadherin domain-containing protein [Nostoc sp. XA010]
MAIYTLTTNKDNIVGTTGNDTFNGTYDAAVTDTFSSGDSLNGGLGIDTLHIDHVLDVAITPPDALWANLRNIENVVINTTGNGAQTITTGINFQTAFAASGVNLTTATSGAGAIDIAMTTFTGATTLRTTSKEGAQTIVTGSGATTVTATSETGALNIKGVGLKTVTATTTGAGAQTIGDGSGNGANLVVVKATSAGGAQTITSTSTSAVVVDATSVAGKQIITTGSGADIVTASTTSPTNTIDTGDGNDRVTILATASGNYTIDGGAGDDTLTGGAGNDILIGGSGDDSLNGGAGADNMIGGDGSDIYYVDIATDVVTETNASAAGGIDTVISSLAAYTLGANLENLTLTGTGNSNGTGNSLDNRIIGNSGNNVLSGGAGADILVGVAGNSLIEEVDTLSGGEGPDLYILASDTSIYYDDRNITTTGNSDYALIVGFNAQEDKVQLLGSSNQYRLDIDGINTNLSIDKPGSEPDELIAVFQNSTGLDLNSAAFKYLISNNNVPTDLSLSNTTVNENVAANSLIGSLSTTDPDASNTSNTFTYNLVSGTGSTDNATFSIVNGNELRINSRPDFEAQSIYTIRVRTTDQGGLSYEEPLLVNVNNFSGLNYIASYGDLTNAFGANEQAGEQHFEKFGRAEGRQITFNGLEYIASYGDLIQAFGANEQTGLQHYFDFGFDEGRTPAFSGLNYIASYGDLISAFGSDEQTGIQHYINFGFDAGRTPISGLKYVASYNDLVNAFGANEQAGLNHYANFGLAEGRQVTFNGLEYIASYDDLIQAFGANEQTGLQHYFNFGFAEGRSSPFDPYDYLASHGDLLNAFGLDTQAATQHYINFGFGEGRTSTAKVDALTGQLGQADRFNVDRALYDDGNNSTPGLTEFALIFNFDPSQDKIQLQGQQSEYVLGSYSFGSRTTQGIFLDTDSSRTLSTNDELLAAVVTATPLSLGASYFSPVG